MTNTLHLAVIKPAPKEYVPSVWEKLFEAWEVHLKPDFSGIVQVSFVSRLAMRELYKQAYGEDRPTDVLSLRHCPQPGMEQIVGGEIVICPAVARVAAARLKTDVMTELATLFVHGLLHLSGLEHDETEDRSRFEQLTHDIMATQSLKAVSLWSV